VAKYWKGMRTGIKMLLTTPINYLSRYPWVCRNNRQTATKNNLNLWWD